MSLPITEAQAYGITYGALVVFTGIAGIAAFFVYRNAKENAMAGADFWYSARDSQNWASLGLSVFASSMGAWVIYAAPETGVTSGWWGVLGYALASTLPFLVLCYLGPLVRARYPEGFCVLDWVAARFGRPTQIYAGIISVFYMWVYLVAELTSIGGLISSFSGLDPLSALVPLSLVTMLYTMAAGLPASIWTDRVQGAMMIPFILIAVIACASGASIKGGTWKQAADWSSRGFEAFVVLIYAIMGAELFNMGTWQRVYAARDERHLRRGLILGACLIFPTMVLFGVLGMLAKAQDLSSAKPGSLVPPLAFFSLLTGQSTFIKCVTFALAVSMVASSVDSLQTGLLAVISKDIAAKKLSPLLTTGMGQLLVLVANIPAIWLAAESTKDPELNYSVIDLFLIADLLTCTMIVPVFMGLGPLATQNGVLAGCMSGLLTIFIFGWAEFGTFAAGVEMVTLLAFDSIANLAPKEYGLSAHRTCILFFVIPVITGAMTFMVSATERVLNAFSYKKMDDPPPIEEEPVPEATV